jgi:hypothetical protein
MFQLFRKLASHHTDAACQVLTLTETILLSQSPNNPWVIFWWHPTPEQPMDNFLVESSILGI